MGVEAPASNILTQCQSQVIIFGWELLKHPSSPELDAIFPD